MRVGFLIEQQGQRGAEEQSAWQWLSKHHAGSRQVSFDDLGRRAKQFDVLWWHYAGSVTIPDAAKFPEALDTIQRHLRGGKGLILSLLAAQYVVDLGVESLRPDVVRLGGWDEDSWVKDYPDIRGFGSNQGHPVFDGLQGAVFTWNPERGSDFAGSFYSAPRTPAGGKVIAVERQYIRLNEDRRIMCEYEVGKGRILTIGSHVFFRNSRDRFRLHLEKLVSNCLVYAANPPKTKARRTYWNFGPRDVREAPTTESPAIKKKSGSKEHGGSGLAITREPGEVKNAAFNVGGRRILIMGKEQTGIQEVWSHPFRMLRNLRIGYRLGSDQITWCDQIQPQVTIRPESITRVYTVGELRLEETTAGSVDLPGGVVNLHIDSNHPLDVVITGSIDLRLMWPHSEQATGSIEFNWDAGLQAYAIANESKTMTGIVGLSGMVQGHAAGKYSGFKFDGDSLQGIPSDYPEVQFGFHVAVRGKNVALSLVFAGSESSQEVLKTFRRLASDPHDVVSSQAKHVRDLFRRSTIIESPSPAFNDGYRWALAATDRFFVETPSLGSSLMAGFGTTERGWDGGQKVSGRPGYAWYFGRDACWTAFAMLLYGAHEPVREVLQFLGNHQDLNGKILHELTTSGHVHYDAADSTPLYIMLMGRYLRTTGDVAFVRSQFARLEKAVKLCLSTDTDGDHLIENTNVGHGWVEGGKLFPVHAELYLQACWASALGEAAGIARVMKKTALGTSWQRKGGLVRKAIKERFWNNRTRFYNFALRADGTFVEEKTVLPAVAILLGMTEPQKAKECLAEYAGSDFSADWGVRIIGKNNSLFNPSGYHHGSVWPLFTGWTALAEFTSGRFVQGFTHAMSTMLIFRHWAAGYVEEVLHGEEFRPEGVCSHQAWSESMVLQPLLEGMLGIRHSDNGSVVTIRPYVPPPWKTVRIRSIRAGIQSFDLIIEKRSGTITYTILPHKPTKAEVRLEPVIPPKAFVKSVTINGKKHSKGLNSIVASLHSKTVVIVEYRGGISLEPPVPDLREGEISGGIRVIAEEHEKGHVSYTFEGIEGKKYDLHYEDPAGVVRGAENAELIDRTNELRTFRVTIPGGDPTRYRRTKVSLLT